jgi:hypothetical protein
LLDARRVAKELEGVMEKIRQTNELFLVQVPPMRKQKNCTHLEARLRPPSGLRH